jgi:hypothetical protein
MLNSRIRDLAVAGTMVISAIALTGLAATGASAATAKTPNQERTGVY